VSIQVERVNSELAANDIPLKVLPGQEIRVFNELLAEYERGNLLTLGRSNFLLLELPSDRIPKGCFELLHELHIIGLTPIIAHPERNREIARHPERLTEMVEKGALSQVTASSVDGAFGQSLQKVALQLCRNHAVHFIASDAHNTTTRQFSIINAFQTIDKKISTEFAQIYRANAMRLAVGDEVMSTGFMRQRRKAWYNFWKSK
jgi:protein-tyrosine phosphatase